jgi:hypothetical protein
MSAANLSIVDHGIKAHIFIPIIPPYRYGCSSEVEPQVVALVVEGSNPFSHPGGEGERVISSL